MSALKLASQRSLKMLRNLNSELEPSKARFLVACWLRLARRLKSCPDEIETVKKDLLSYKRHLERIATSGAAIISLMDRPGRGPVPAVRTATDLLALHFVAMPTRDRNGNTIWSMNDLRGGIAQVRELETILAQLLEPRFEGTSILARIAAAAAGAAGNVQSTMGRPSEHARFEAFGALREILEHLAPGCVLHDGDKGLALAEIARSLWPLVFFEERDITGLLKAMRALDDDGRPYVETRYLPEALARWEARKMAA